MLGQPPSVTPPLPFQSTIQELQVTSAEGGVGTLWVGCLWDSVSNQFCWLLSHPSAWFWHPSVSVFVSERVSHHCPMISVHKQPKNLFFTYNRSKQYINSKHTRLCLFRAPSSHEHWLRWNPKVLHYGEQAESGRAPDLCYNSGTSTTSFWPPLMCMHLPSYFAMSIPIK